MKIGIVSDTHMMNKFIDKAIPYLKECDLLIHAGDNFLDSRYIHKMTNVDMMAVKGNCDYNDVEEELIFEVEDKTIFLCHGDRYEVKYGIDVIEKKAKSVNADIVIFGHTHTPLCQEKEDILYINPGSLSLPRNVTYRSFVILEIEDGKSKVTEVSI